MQPGTSTAIISVVTIGMSAGPMTAATIGAIAAVCDGGIGAEQLGQKLDDDAGARRQIAPGWPDGRQRNAQRRSRPAIWPSSNSHQSD
jgi:hypothetical protein